MPQSAADFLLERGHEVAFLRDIMRAAKDDQLAAMANRNNAIVVSCNDRDFKKLIAKIPEGNRTRFRKASRISLACKQTRAALRLQQLVRSIEFEFAEAQGRGDQCLIITIRDTNFTVHA